MGKIPPLSTLRTEDYPSEQRAWLPRLFLPLNSFLTAASAAINGNIEFGSNIPAQDQVLSFTYNGLAQRFAWNGNADPVILWVGQATEGGITTSVLPIWSFDSSSRTVTVNFKRLNGENLSIGASYRIVIRAVP
jgi:hypothetical protein